MSTSSRKWTQGLHFSSLFHQPPQDSQQHQAQVLAYVKLFAQFTSEEFPDDIAELVRSHYPNCKSCLLDDVLATFVLHHPEHGHAFIHPLLSCIIDGTLTYDRATPPFSSFISLFSPSSQNDFSEQWALACGEILRVLTHYNRPVYKRETILNKETERCVSGSSASTSNCEPNQSSSPADDSDKKPLRLLTPWITDILLAAPLGIRSDYFRWCGGVMGKYAAAGELKPPTTAGLRGPGKHPQLMPSTPRWAVANGAGVILSVCDDEVNRYETAHLTAAAVPALLLPPPTTALDEHLVAGLPPLEPYARLFHRYYAIASPSATQRLLLGLLEAPPSWAPDALDAAVQLVELLRAAEDYATNMRLPKTWIHLHFLRAIGTALSMRAGIVADAAAALLFRILSQPALLFPPRHAQCLDHQRDIQNCFVSSNNDVKIESTAYQENIEATAQGVASLMCTHGPEVEWRICTLWEAAYGLLPLSSSAVDLPEIVVASPLQPPILSWSLFHPLLRVLEYLPRGSPSESSLIKIFTVTVEEVLKRTFPMLNSIENAGLIETFHGSFRSTSKNLAATELRAMVHSLFTETCPSMDVASRLLFVLLTVCLSHDAAQQYGRKEKVERSIVLAAKEQQVVNGKQKVDEDSKNRDRGAVAAFDSYVLAALCALACEVQLLALPSRVRKFTQIAHATCSGKTVKTAKLGKEAQSGINSAASHIRRLLGILESLLSLKPSSVGLCPRNCSSSEIVASAVVAAHVSNLLVCSKASKQALLILKRCKWDSDVCAKASSVLALIDANGKAVAAVSEKSRHIKHHLEEREALSGDACSYERNYAASKSGCVSEENARKSSTMQTDSKKLKWENSSKIESLEKEDCVSGKTIASLPMNAVEVATLLAMERHDAANGNVEYLVKFVLKEKQNLCIAAVPLLWQRLITAPDMEMSVESTSAEQGWRQLVKALCNIVLASPVKAAAAIVLQVERDLQPWVVKDDTEGQRMWRVNQRIASLFAEILRLHNVPAAWIVLLDASELLLRATDGILVDGEACATPQLELLQATAVAARLSISWGSAGNILGERLWNLLKSRLGPIVQCLSHCSAHVRALSRAVLWDSLHTESLSIMYDNKQVDKEPGSKDLCATEHMTFQGWRNDVEECLTWEACRRKEQGMSIILLASAANALGCSITF